MKMGEYPFLKQRLMAMVHGGESLSEQKKEEKDEMLSKFCESCGGEVELQNCTGSPFHQNSAYKCKVCGHIQGTYKEFQKGE
jgi:hypothetical protein